MNEFLSPSEEQDASYLGPLRRYYDSCRGRDRYDDLLIAAIELCDDQIGDGVLQSLLVGNPDLIPNEGFFDISPMEAKERFMLLPLELLADTIDVQCDEDLMHSWLDLALNRIKDQSEGHDLEGCLDDEAYVHSHSCRSSQLCPVKYVRNYLIVDSYVGQTEQSVYLQVDQLYVERVANDKRDMAQYLGLITETTHYHLESDYYNAHYPKR